MAGEDARFLATVEQKCPGKWSTCPERERLLREHDERYDTCRR